MKTKPIKTVNKPKQQSTAELFSATKKQDFRTSLPIGQAPQRKPGSKKGAR